MVSCASACFPDVPSSANRMLVISSAARWLMESRARNVACSEFKCVPASWFEHYERKQMQFLSRSGVKTTSWQADAVWQSTRWLFQVVVKCLPTFGIFMCLKKTRCCNHMFAKTFANELVQFHLVRQLELLCGRRCSVSHTLVRPFSTAVCVPSYTGKSGSFWAHFFKNESCRSAQSQEVVAHCSCSLKHIALSISCHAHGNDVHEDYGSTASVLRDEEGRVLMSDITAWWKYYFFTPCVRIEKKNSR